jgi:hypothetical protein
MIEFVVRRGLRVVSVTDHDSTEGLSEAIEAARAFPQLTFIPGVELSTDVPENEVHILGYFIDHQDSRLQEALFRFRNSREVRARRMLEKLAGMGMELDWERIKELAGGGAIGRPHIALAMRERGYISELHEAFARYIGRNGPAYVEREKLTPREAVRLIVQAGGLAVLGHPAELPNIEEMIRELKEVGLVGLEVFYAPYSIDRVEFLAGVAARHRLIPTGGSDYHALNTPGEALPGDMGPPMEVVERLMGMVRERVRLRGGS